MRLHFLLVTAIAVTTPVMAQEAASSAGAEKPAVQDAGADLPVSLDRIRDGLKKPQELSLRNLDVKADFSVRVDEQRRIDALMSKLDFRSGPAPAGGLYGYEQQRRLFNPTDRPLQQPYAAYSGAEFTTVAIENLIAKYLGGHLLKVVASAERSRAEEQARAEVAEAVAAYCEGRSDREDILICSKN